MSGGPWADLLLEVLGEADATPEWDHLLHHVEEGFDATLFEEEIKDAVADLEAEGRLSYSGVQGYEVVPEQPARPDGGERTDG